MHVFGNLTVVPHEANADVLVVDKGGLVADETDNDLTAKHMPQEKVLSDGEVSRRVDLITSLVKNTVLVDGIISTVIIVDRDVRSIPSVGVPNHEDGRGGEERTEEAVEDAVEGGDEEFYNNGKLVPVKGGNGIAAKASNTAGNRGKVDAIWGDPDHLVEVRHGMGDVVGELEVGKHCAGATDKPPHPRGGPAINNAVYLRVWRGGAPWWRRDQKLSKALASAVIYIPRDSHQVAWTNGARRVYEESPGNTGEIIPNKVGRKDDED